MDKSQVADFKRPEQENARLKVLLVERDLEIEVMKEINAKKMIVSERITAVQYAIGRGIPQRKACTLLQVSRSMLA